MSVADIGVTVIDVAGEGHCVPGGEGGTPIRGGDLQGALQHPQEFPRAGRVPLAFVAVSFGQRSSAHF